MNLEYIKTHLLFINNQVIWFVGCMNVDNRPGMKFIGRNIKTLRQHIMKNYLGVFVLQNLMEKFGQVIEHIWLLINKKLGICLIYMETYVIYLIWNDVTRCNRQSSAIYYLADPLTIGLNNIDSVTDTFFVKETHSPKLCSWLQTSLVSLNEV